MRKPKIKSTTKVLLYGFILGTILSMASCQEKKGDTRSEDYIYQYSIIEVDKASGLVVETIDSEDFFQADFETNREDELNSEESGGVK